ncbi:helix-turn-helix domain-containing protein [Chenggangzhangella methanolivorans]|uniref:helix-turn-helix domain-containing protein n=1 Tax=Chenggangzhangella methanolivorans TaxID=1437009 RepID=UPI0021BD8B13|nr:helix-turn-helix transcriptional regulator [Chenggangzhangella methanolivorans]
MTIVHWRREAAPGRRPARDLRQQCPPGPYKNGLEPGEACLAAGFHRVYVSRLESGKWNVSLDNVERIASALGVDPIELLLHPRSSSPKADDATS